jgi:hypothetical protein
MIKEVQETRYENKYGNRFLTEKEALDDENLRDPSSGIFIIELPDSDTSPYGSFTDFIGKDGKIVSEKGYSSDIICRGRYKEFSSLQEAVDYAEGDKRCTEYWYSVRKFIGPLTTIKVLTTYNPETR